MNPPTNLNLLQGIHILLVDNESATAVIRLFERLGAFTSQRITVEDAKIELGFNRYDVILLDHHLGSHLGFQLARWMLRPDRPAAIQNILRISYSGSANMSSVLAAVPEDERVRLFDALISKDEPPLKVARQIRELVDARRASVDNPVL